jgi:hypothetical protein
MEGVFRAINTDTQQCMVSNTYFATHSMFWFVDVHHFRQDQSIKICSSCFGSRMDQMVDLTTRSLFGSSHNLE